MVIGGVRFRPGCGGERNRPGGCGIKIHALALQSPPPWTRIRDLYSESSKEDFVMPAGDLQSPNTPRPRGQCRDLQSPNTSASANSATPPDSATPPPPGAPTLAGA